MDYHVVEISEKKWLNWVSSFSSANIFHHPVWIGLLAGCYGYKPIYLTMQDGRDHISSGLPLLKITSLLTGRRMVCLPFTDFYQPIITNPKDMPAFIELLEKWRKKHDSCPIEIRWPLLEHAGVYKGSSFANHLTLLDADPNTVYSKFKKKSVHASIVQGSKSGIMIKKGDDWTALRTFYDLHCQTRKRQGTPVQPLRFFKMLHDKLLSKGYGFVLLAYMGDIPIAGGVFLCWNKILIYKYGASDTAHWNLRPNNLLIWHAIRWGCENGCNVFDWGKTELANEGLISFKRHWGSKEELLNYSILADRAPNIATEGKSRRLLAYIIERSPVWFCRAIGETLYGHFG